LRIVAGAWRGRQIKAPDDDLVRPTGDRVREAWLSIVGSAIPGARVLDLFAGSGALGLEALSRGATEAHFVETSPKSIAAITSNAAALGAGPRAVIHRVDALRFLDGLEAGQFDVAFADPPYDKKIATRVAEQWLKRPFATILGIEHRQDERLPRGDDRRKYGETALTFYRAAAPADDSATLSDTTDHESR
jgi:16S rRNA (guanine966-N2)-methyltransferase